MRWVMTRVFPLRPGQDEHRPGGEHRLALLGIEPREQGGLLTAGGWVRIAQRINAEVAEMAKIAPGREGPYLRALSVSLRVPR
jgi:hypothetical protein